jgi:very-short-patch-repair endonuclease
VAKRDLISTNIPPLKARRKELRNNPTPAEAILWKHPQRRRMLGKKFRRQFSISRYIVDFFCLDCGIAIELDGAPHFRELRAEYEARRAEFLTGLGIEVIRFENRIVHETSRQYLKRSGKRYGTGMVSDLPRYAEAEVALHLFDRRGDPSSEEGNLTLPTIN